MTPETGKQYVTRGGAVTSPLRTNSDGLHAFRAQIGRIWVNYFANGRVHDYESAFDLIEEYVEKPRVLGTVANVGIPDEITGCITNATISPLGSMVDATPGLRWNGKVLEVLMKDYATGAHFWAPVPKINIGKAKTK